MELKTTARIGLAFMVGVWSLAAQFIFNRIIFFYIANSEYVAASIISIHLAGFWAGTLVAKRWKLDISTLLALTLLTSLMANIIVWRIGAATFGLPITVIFAVLCGLMLASLSGALVVCLMGYEKEDGRGVIVADSAGSVLGAILGGFILIPKFGLSTSFTCVMILQSIALGGVIASQPLRVKRLAVLIILLIATAGLNLYSPNIKPSDMIVVDGLPVEPVNSEEGSGRVLYSDTTPYGVLSVIEKPDSNRFLLIDNRPLCFTEPGGMEGHSEWALAVTAVEMMKWVVRDERRVANIGLGCGNSLSGLLEGMDNKGSLDLIEINKGMPKAQEHLWPHQKNTPADKRVTLHIEDGFRYFAERKNMPLYDIVLIDLAWMQNMNATHLFSKEMYENVARNLVDDGVLAIWSEETNPVSPVSLIIYRTLREVFPYVVIDDAQGVMLFYASKTRGDLRNFLPADAAKANQWIDDIGMMAPVNRLDNLVMNRHKFNLFGDSTWERLVQKYAL